MASAYIKNSSKSFQKIKRPKATEIQLSHHTLEVLFKSLVCSSLEYADVVWDGCSESDSNFLESLQIEVALKGTNRISILNKLSWVELSARRKIHKLSLMYKMVYNLS